MQSTTDIKVRGYQVDHFGHVNHARYVEFLEEARWALFDRHQPMVDRLHARGIAHAVVRLEIDYRTPAKLGDVLRIETRITEVGRSSVVVVQQIVRLADRRLVAEARVTNVFLEQATGTPICIREELLPLAQTKK